MDKTKVISAIIPENVYNEMVLRIPEGNRSNFIREAIIDKLQKTPKPDKLIELEKKIKELENNFAEIRKSLADLELLTYHNGKINPHVFCIDQIDHKIVEYLLHYQGATTPELAEYLKTNRWLILNRLRKIQRYSKKQIGKEILYYCAREKSGKKKAWWINQNLIDL
ncbi:MAG: hypothetical protein AC479_01410 [miscellaneous Crenarchaeota group-6 archaeon AD8-1]|nr:MAG: hypothetical protein AC479_01410 [miscellaneous Crenarchaeota group-6 archaeon AD8-1]